MPVAWNTAMIAASRPCRNDRPWQARSSRESSTLVNTGMSFSVTFGGRQWSSATTSVMPIRPPGTRTRTSQRARPARAGRAPRLRAELVVRGGVEPPTFRFSGGRSYQLSYLAAYALRS